MNPEEHALAISFAMARAGTPEYYEEDVRAFLHLVLWETWKNFDPSKGTTFETRATMMLNWRAVDEVRRLTNFCRANECSRTATAFSSQPETLSGEAFDPIDDSKVVDAVVIQRDFLRVVRKFVATQSKLCKTLFEETILSQMPLVSVAQQYGISISRCSRVRTALLANIRNLPACIDYGTTDILSE